MVSLNLVTKIINKSNIEEELYELFDCVDCDFNGVNGEEYLWDVAKENGFDSNLDYALKEARDKHGDNLEEVIRYVLTSAQSTWNGYYDNWIENIIEVNGEFIVSLATTSS